MTYIHHGEIIEKAVRESGHSIIGLSEKMNKSRRWVYQIFDSSKVPIEYILQIGKIIHHDFSDDFKFIHPGMDDDKLKRIVIESFIEGNRTEVDIENLMEAAERFYKENYSK